jgi:uncharacterized secreted protein with C-terminal beta-propeller domain
MRNNKFIRLAALLILIASLILPTISEKVLAEMKVLYSRKGTVMRHIPLPEIGDCNVLMRHLMKGQEPMYYDDVAEGAREVTMDAEAPTATSKSQALGTTAGGSEDFSTTNIQVEGVDEADIVKTDGEYIYIVKGKGVRIIKAYPVSQLEEIATIRDDESSFRATELYVEGDRLVIIGNVSGYYGAPYHWRGNITKVYVYDISNMNNITEERSVEFEGNYYTSRRIDDMLYLVMNQHVYYHPLVRDMGTSSYSEEGIVPYMTDSAVGESEPLTKCSDIAFFPGYHQPNYLIAASIPLDDTDISVKRKVYLGATDNVYVSQDNLYVTMRTYPWIDTFAEIWPPIPRSVFESTLVYKFELDDGAIEYDGAGEVPGTVLNQFSMDEHRGNFRIATTRGNLWGEGESLARNNLYVLDEDMDRIGEIEDIAPGEKIYSVRFMGDRAYMVTFKNIDPLFVIGLEDPENPEILGKLKIPGYSDYLHPYDENHIIGFGKDAVPSEKDETFAWYQGMKIALFDVSDVKNPKQKFQEIIGDRGTNSELLRNHKALLFSKEKNIIAFPVTVAEIPEGEKDDTKGEDQWQYGDQVFQGLYVYSLSLDRGFNLRGRITHISDEDMLKSGYQIGDPRDHVKRGLYIDDFLYTISNNKVQAHTLTLFNKRGSIELESDPGEDYYPYYRGIEPMIDQ